MSSMFLLPVILFEFSPGDEIIQSVQCDWNLSVLFDSQMRQTSCDPHPPPPIQATKDCLTPPTM